MTNNCRSVAGIVAFSAAASPGAALAHSPIEGIGTFYGHMLHPVVAPAHALLLLGTTLLLGQQPRQVALLGLLSFGLAFVVGLTLSGSGLVPTISEQLLLGAAMLAGCLVSLNLPLHATVIIAAACAAGLLMGLDSAPDTAGNNQLALAYSGLLFGVFAIALIVTGSTVGLVRAWQRIGIRVAGSWIVAISVLALALSLSARSTAIMAG